MLCTSSIFPYKNTLHTKIIPLYYITHNTYFIREKFLTNKKPPRGLEFRTKIIHRILTSDVTTRGINGLNERFRDKREIRKKNRAKKKKKSPKLKNRGPKRTTSVWPINRLWHPNWWTKRLVFQLDIFMYIFIYHTFLFCHF